jgi:hypothetical protein
MTNKEVTRKEQNVPDQANELILTVKKGFQIGTAIHDIAKSLFEAVLTH